MLVRPVSGATERSPIAWTWLSSGRKNAICINEEAPLRRRDHKIASRRLLMSGVQQRARRACAPIAGVMFLSSRDAATRQRVWVMRPNVALSACIMPSYLIN